MGGSHYRVTIFAGDSLDDLDFVGSTATITNENDLIEFVVPMVEGEHYTISVGFPPRDVEFITGNGFGRYEDVLRWGATPENDDFDGAIALHGPEGNMTFSTRWSTRDAGEQATAAASDTTSDSIWYTYETNETGWYEFFIPEIDLSYTNLTVYQSRGGRGIEFPANGGGVLC